MTQAQVPLIVLTARQDDVELINRTLREAGHAAHCHWVAKLEQLPEALASRTPELLVFFSDTLPVSLADVAKIKAQADGTVPLIAVQRDAVDETAIAQAMKAGARDLVSAGQTARLRSVAERELRAFRLERALNQTLQSATQYKKQLKAFMEGSVDAIAYVQEGILVDANQAWAELFGHKSPDDLHGPLMDLFDGSSQVALKGALVACAKGQWDGRTLKLGGALPDGTTLPLDVKFESATLDGEPAIKLTVARKPPEKSNPEQLFEQAVHVDPSTGFYHRRRFLELLSARFAAGPRTGVRALAYIRPDKFGEVEDEVGPLASEEILVQLAQLLRSLVHDNDLYGRFGGTVFALLLERGTLRDIEAWAENALARIADHIFEVEQNTLSITCTIGLAEVGPTTTRIEELLAGAERANQRGRQRGGNQVVVEETSDESTRIQRFDEFWVHQIKSALMENRFRLAHLPIAPLGGEHKNMLDTVLRLVDQQGDEVPASEFMPAAGRNRLLRAIDRWVIGATIPFCFKTKPDCVFVKLSFESIVDQTLLDWLLKQVREYGLEPARLCFQVTEEDATQYLKQTKTLAEQLKANGFLFAIEHFGIGRDPLRILTQTPVHYIKIDGSLMQSLATNHALQEKVRGFINAAERRKVQTIAERVEDANTMAVLFQLGVGYMQGHYVHEPEVVLQEQ